jgi:hypothetical protein
MFWCCTKLNTSRETGIIESGRKGDLKAGLDLMLSLKTSRKHTRVPTKRICVRYISATLFHSVTVPNKSMAM